jgi:hypothetical protein
MQADGGMDGLAKSLGLDIEACALKLAIHGSSGLPPTHCVPVEIDEKEVKKLKQKVNQKNTQTPKN